MLHLYTPHHNAGAEIMVHAMLRALADDGHTVDVILSRDHPAITDTYSIDDVTVHPRHSKGDPVRWLTGPRRPDVIVTHLENAHRAQILGQLHGVPVIVVAHNTFDETFDSVVRMPELVVYNTEWMRRELTGRWERRRGERRKPRSIVIRPPVNADDYRVKPGKAITLINLCEAKGARTFYALADRYPDRQFLGVRGAYGEQDVRERQNVEILDHVAGPAMPAEVYARTKVLLVPSSYESYGRVAIEAASSGIPVIAHPTPGLREALGEAGIFANRNDTDAWDEALSRLLTPRGWSNSSRAVAARAQELNPADDLLRWVTAVREVCRRGPTPRHLR
jgi:glycosyltransferase involved in cell wall biosynthesis